MLKVLLVLILHTVHGKACIYIAVLAVHIDVPTVRDMDCSQHSAVFLNVKVDNLIRMLCGCQGGADSTNLNSGELPFGQL